MIPAHFHIHFSGVHYALFGIAGLLLILFVVFKWSFVKEALSENGTASSKRVIAVIITAVISFNEVYHTLKKQEFDYNHLVALLITLCLLLGIATVPQILELWKDKKES